MKKIVDGVEVELTKEEEIRVLATWEFNNKYPNYQNCLVYHASAYAELDSNKKAMYNLEKAKEIFIQRYNQKIDLKIAELDAKLYKAILEDEFLEKNKLKTQKREILQKKNIDIDSFKSIDELVEKELEDV